MKTTLNDQEIFNQKGISFFNDILKKKVLKRKNSKNNTSMGKSSSKSRKKVNSFIPSQKQLFKLMKKEQIYAYKSIKKNKDKIIHDYNHNNFSSPSLVKDKIAKKSDNSRGKPPIIYIKDSNSSINIFKNNLNNLNSNNNLTSSRSRSIIRRRIDNKENIYIHEEYLTNNKEITSESNINININALPFTEREKYSKKIYFTIAPHINNMINLNKIEYMKRTSSRENIINTCNNDLKISKNIKNKINTKNSMVNKKNINFNKNKNIINKKKSNSFKSSYKNSNTQVSSSMGTASCHLVKIHI